MIERLGPQVGDELCVGLLCPAAARRIVQPPEGDKAEGLEVMRHEAPSTVEPAATGDHFVTATDTRAAGCGRIFRLTRDRSGD